MNFIKIKWANLFNHIFLAKQKYQTKPLEILRENYKFSTRPKQQFCPIHYKYGEFQPFLFNTSIKMNNINQ